MTFQPDASQTNLIAAERSRLLLTQGERAMTSIRTFLLLLLLLLAGAVETFAQAEQAAQASAPPAQASAPAAPTVTVSISARGLRFIALGQVKQMRLEVYSAQGDALYNSEFQAGNVRDWALEDKQGQRLADGTYLCVVTVRDLSGRWEMKQGTVLMQGGQASLKLGEGGKVGAVEAEKGLAPVAEGAAPALTIVAHDGQDGQVISTKGALSFRTGDVFSGADKEQMRLTEDGRLGLGTEKPQATLDVAGTLRARDGIVFSDGTALTSAGKAGKMTNSGVIEPNVSGTGTANQITKWNDAAGTLVNSALYESGGKVGLGTGTTTPPHPFTVKQNGGTAGVHTFGELYVDRDTNNRSASLIVGTAGVLKWIFGMPAGTNGFQVYDLATNQTRFFVDPTSGNIGMGTTTPASKLDVAGDLKVSGNAVVAGNIAAKYQDIAEWVPAREQMKAGTVVILDAQRTNTVTASFRRYDTHVAGVVSAQPGVVLGEGGAGKVLVATTGRVRVRVDARRSPVRIGDLLVTSGRAGVAMRSQPLRAGGALIHRPGTIIGKALEPLAQGQGEILVLLSLQ
jgi:hypothetical protein